MPSFSMLKTWEDCRICWEAKGYKLDSITPELMKVGKYGRSKIGKLMNTTRNAPQEVVDLVWSLEFVPGASERKYELYLRGLEASEHGSSLPSPAPRADEIADKVAARIPSAGEVADKVAAKLPGAAEIADRVVVSARIENALGAIGAQVEAAFVKTEETLGAVGAKVETASAKTGGQLAELAANVGDASGKLDQASHTLQLVHAQQGRMDMRVRGLGQALWGLSGVLALGFAALVFVAWRNVTVDLGLVFNGVPGIHGEMGEPKTGKPVPDHPRPGQWRPPCGLGATELSGGCWIKVADQTPPCLPRFYFRGNGCYLPAFPDFPKPDDKPQFSPNPE